MAFSQTNLSIIVQLFTFVSMAYFCIVLLKYIEHFLNNAEGHVLTINLLQQKKKYLNNYI